MMQVDTRRVMEAVGEAGAEKRRELFEDVEPAETEEFDLANGPLGHLQNHDLDEAYFSAATWEAFFEEIADTTELHDSEYLAPSGAPANAPANAPAALQTAFDL